MGWRAHLADFYLELITGGTLGRLWVALARSTGQRCNCNTRPLHVAGSVQRTLLCCLAPMQAGAGGEAQASGPVWDQGRRQGCRSFWHRTRPMLGSMLAACAVRAAVTSVPMRGAVTCAVLPSASSWTSGSDIWGCVENHWRCAWSAFRASSCVVREAVTGAALPRRSTHLHGGRCPGCPHASTMQGMFMPGR